MIPLFQALIEGAHRIQKSSKEQEEWIKFYALFEFLFVRMRPSDRDEVFRQIVNAKRIVGNEVFEDSQDFEEYLKGLNK